MSRPTDEELADHLWATLRHLEHLWGTALGEMAVLRDARKALARFYGTTNPYRATECLEPDWDDRKYPVCKKCGLGKFQHERYFFFVEDEVELD